MESPAEVQGGGLTYQEDFEEHYEQPFPFKLEPYGYFPAADAGGAVALDTGATAILTCFKWAANRNSVPNEFGNW